MKRPMKPAAAKALNDSVAKFMLAAECDLNNVQNVASVAPEHGEDATVYQRHALRHARSQLRLAAARVDRALRRHGDNTL